MSNLEYRTRAMSSPKGKPKIYFCCHEDDFGTYFNPIAEEILKIVNCSIWYPKSLQNGKDEEFYEDLTQMQLFVVPVTTNFLCRDNDALNFEFKLAQEYNIPILPLMQEAGLEGIFNQKCGELQFLDKSNSDATAISYEEKLEKFLSSVLVGDDVAEKIRAAFQAYIFLSYRKKDRKYAQKLMKLIHKNDFCRDIAIWYDEFLIPGENFNDSIKDALEKSRLFVLTVTPNIVNEINYILTTEYPLAQEMGKPILPVELVKTDREELNKSYQNFPFCTNAENEEMLSSALLEEVKKLALAENENSPEQRFLIGLAYLSGIDVEVDCEKALSLITSSAESGLVYAMEKLSQMYRFGQGVKRNHEKALFWSKKRIEELESDYNLNPDEEKLNDIFWDMINLGSYYEDMGDLENAKDIRFNALKIVNNSPFINENVVIERNLAYAYEYLGQVFDLEGDLYTARKLYERAYEIFENVAPYIDEERLSYDMAVLSETIGHNAKACGSIETAEKHYHKAYEYFKSIAFESNDADDMAELAGAYENLANIASKKGDFSKAKEYYMLSLEIYKLVDEEKYTFDSKSSLSTSYCTLASICEIEEDFSKAEEYYKTAIDICAKLNEDYATVHSTEQLAMTYGALAGLYKKQGNNSLARDYYVKSLEIIDDALCFDKTAYIRQYHYFVYMELGEIFYKAKNYSVSKKCYSNAYTICGELTDDVNIKDVDRDMAKIYMKLGEVLKADEDYEEAEEYYNFALMAYKKIVEKDSDAAMNENIMNIYYNLAALNEEKYTEYLKKALEIADELSQNYPESEKYKQLSAAFRQLLS